MVMEYLGHCYELSDMLSDALKLGPNKISANISAAITLWFGNDIMNEIGIDWLQRLNINAFILLQTAHEFLKLSDKLFTIAEVEQIKDIKKLYLISADHRDLIDGYVFFNFLLAKEGFNFFNQDEESKINNFLNTKQYDCIKEVFRKKVELALTFYRNVLQLKYFIGYLEKNLNNYRTVKIQLREAVLLQQNYLDYLLKDFPIDPGIDSQINKIKSESKALKDINEPQNNLKDFINHIFFHTYITKYNKEQLDYDESKFRLWIYKGDKRSLIVMTGKENKETKSLIKDMQGEIVLSQNLDKKELEEINTIADMLSL